MNDYLKEYKKYKDIKEVENLISEIEKLRYLYNCQNYNEMQNYVNELMRKYMFETIAWNSVNSVPASNYHEMYQNAESFLRSKLMMTLNSVIKK